MIREMAVTFAQEVVGPRVDEIEEADHFPDDIFEQMIEMGFLGINFPEKYGGLEMNYLAQTIAMEEIAKVSPSAATVYNVTLLPLEAIHMFGNETQKEKYLPAGLAGEFKGSFAFTEAETGSDPKQLITTAKKVGDGKYVINGVKRFISNAAYEGPIVLFTKEAESGECTSFIVEKFCKGYSISTPWEKVGLQGSNIYDVFFDDVEVTEEDILGEHGKGFDYLIGATTYGKLAFSAVFTGAMAGAYELAKQYAKEKLHRGKPIAKFPTVQSRIAQIAANTKAAELMLFNAAAFADTHTNIKEVQCETALLKGYIADTAEQTVMMALNVLGSYGVCKEYKVERLLRDTLIGPNIEGAADIQRLIAGSTILRS